jgi:hypothetical protein
VVTSVIVDDANLSSIAALEPEDDPFAASAADGYEQEGTEGVKLKEACVAPVLR